MAIYPMGDVFDVASDAWDATGGRVVGAGADLATSILDRVPGGSALRGALGDLINGPLRDFANTVPGRIFFTAVGSVFYDSIAWTVGPQLASVAFAVPGLAAGDDAVTAYLQGVKTRAEQTAQIIGIPGLGNEFGNDLQKALKAFAEEYGFDETIGEAAWQIAARLGVRLDAAAFAKAIWNKEPLPLAASFSINGGQLPPGKLSAAGASDPSLVAKFAAMPVAPRTTTAAGGATELSTLARFFGAPPPAPVAAPSYDRAVAAPSGPPWGAIAGFGAVVVATAALAWFAAGRE